MEIVQCECEEAAETPRHVLLHCSLEEGRRGELRQASNGLLGSAQLLEDPNLGATVASGWCVQVIFVSFRWLGGFCIWDLVAASRLDWDMQRYYSLRFILVCLLYTIPLHARTFTVVVPLGCAYA